jgi:CRP-like cAMP-binding protein
MELLPVVSDAGSLEELALNNDTATYHKKQLIYKEGGIPHYLYYILKGKVRAYKTHEDGKQLVVSLYNAGDYLGFTALLEEAAYKSTAEALEDTELVLIPKKCFEDLLHKNVAVANRMIKILAKNISEKESQLLKIAYDTLRKKVANALVTLDKKYHKDKNEPFYIDLTRVELAAIAGTATESLIRTLGEFKQEKLIEINKLNQIELTDIKKLEHLLR